MRDSSGCPFLFGSFVIQAKLRDGKRLARIDRFASADSLPVLVTEMPVPRTTVILALLSALAVPPQSLANPGLNGTYQGFIWSGGRNTRGTTSLAVGPDGTISGNYLFEDMGSTIEGQLTDCVFAAPILRCTWNDAYGTGALLLHFTGDFWAFEGSWHDGSLTEAEQRPDNGYRWTGAKVGT